MNPKKEIVECPSNCGGCSCHISHPCSHCVEGHLTPKEFYEKN